MNKKSSNNYHGCSNKFKLSILIYFPFLTLLFQPLIHAEVVQPNIRYEGGSQIQYPNHGVTFTLPENVYGMASPENPQMEFVVALADYAEAGDNGIYIQLGQGDLDQAADQMSRPMTFKEALLNPIGTPQKVEGAAYNDFEYTDEGKQYYAFMLMVMTSGNNAVIFVAASPKAMFSTYKQTVASIAQSILFVDPNAITNQPNQPNSSNTTTGSNSNVNLASELFGAWMNRHNSSNGIYIETNSKWVFSGDGTVAWGSGAIIAGGTAGVSLRGGGDNPPDYGRWSTEGERLTIQWNDGTEGNWTFSVFDYDGRPALALKANGKSYYYKKID